MAVIIQTRHDTAANFTSANTLLADGELAIETDTLKIKMGDGTTAWNSLAYIPTGGDVESVNGQTGVVVLDAEDVGALPDSTVIPTDTADLTNGAGFITSSALTGYEQKATVQLLSATDSITLADNTIYNGSTQTALTIALWSAPIASSICEIVFSSGATATTLAYPNTIKWIGDDVNSNIFLPVANKRYTVILYYDGAETVGVVKGVE